MIKLTHYDAGGRKSADLHLIVAHVVSFQSANPSGTLIDTTRGGYHVAQSSDQILKLMKDNL